MILYNNVPGNSPASQTFDSQGGHAVAIIRADNFATAMLDIQMKSRNDTRWETLTNGSVNMNSNLKLDYVPVGAQIRGIFSTQDASATNVYLEILQ